MSENGSSVTLNPLMFPSSVDWIIEGDGTIRVKTKDMPTAVKLWQVTNPGARAIFA